MNNNKKIAIVTGAASGIGKAVALMLAELDYSVALVSRQKEKLIGVQKTIIGLKKTADVFPLDIADATAVNNCVNTLINQYGKINVLFNNAGLFHAGTSELNNLELKNMLETNLLGAMYMGNQVAKHMKKQKYGYIFNVASVAGKRAIPFAGGYCASKFGLVGYSDALGEELLSYGVKVTTICPGIVNTPMVADIVKAAKLLKDQLIQPSDIADAVKYLLSLKNPIIIKELIIDCKITEKEISNQL